MARENRGERARRQILDLNISGLSNAEIARQIGVNRSQITRYKKGETSPRKGGKGRNLTLLWKRTQKVLGPGGTVSLTSFFRKVWVKNGEPILPLSIEPLPTYTWPSNAPVAIVAYMKDWVVSTGANWPDKVLSSTFKGSDSMTLGSTGEPEITDALLKVLADMKYNPIEYASIRDVLLRRGA